MVRTTNRLLLTTSLCLVLAASATRIAEDVEMNSSVTVAISEAITTCCYCGVNVHYGPPVNFFSSMVYLVPSQSASLTEGGSAWNPNQIDGSFRDTPTRSYICERPCGDFKVPENIIDRQDNLYFCEITSSSTCSQFPPIRNPSYRCYNYDKQRTTHDGDFISGDSINGVNSANGPRQNNGVTRPREVSSGPRVDRNGQYTRQVER